MRHASAALWNFGVRTFRSIGRVTRGTQGAHAVALAVLVARVVVAAGVVWRSASASAAAPSLTALGDLPGGVVSSQAIGISADGLVVVDHKTSATNDPADLDRRVEGYRLQGASYALTVAATTAEPVARVTFLFLTPAGPVERHLDDLDASVTRVRALVQAGHEVMVEEPGPTA